MSRRRLISMIFFSMLFLTSAPPAPAQDAYFYAKYALAGYGAIDMGYYCDNGALNVAVHGEAKGSLSIAFGGDTPTSASFDGSNGMGPDGYYAQAIVRKATACDQRQSWPLITITSSTGQNLTIHWQ